MYVCMYVCIYVGLVLISGDRYVKLTRNVIEDRSSCDWDRLIQQKLVVISSLTCRMLNA